MVHNRLGGLQVMPPNSDRWYYIKVSYDLLVMPPISGLTMPPSHFLDMLSVTLGIHWLSSVAGFSAPMFIV